MIYVIGTGPGDFKYITPEALEALNKCEIISGYEKYINLIKNNFPDKIFKIYSMRQEIKRCEDALKLSRENKIIGLISGGDSGIYGMAGLILELANNNDKIKIIPGLTSAICAAGILGAPLTNDFAVISLSDLLTPIEIINRRLEILSAGDFVICIYNPGSKTRTENFKTACEIMLKYKSPDTPCGYVKNISRPGEFCEIMKLSEIKNLKPDMNYLIIIGNSQTYIKNNKLITPRGYIKKGA